MMPLGLRLRCPKMRTSDWCRVCHGAHCGEGPVLASLAMLARQSALRVAPGDCAPPIPCVALRGLGAARSGRESRLADRTRKLDLRGCRSNDGVALRIEGNDAVRCPVAGQPTPALRVALPGVLVDHVASGEHGAILPGMTLRRGNVADAAVAVLFIVETVHNLGVITLHFEMDGVPNAPHQ